MKVEAIMSKDFKELHIVFEDRTLNFTADEFMAMVEVATKVIEKIQIEKNESKAKK